MLQAKRCCRNRCSTFFEYLVVALLIGRARFGVADDRFGSCMILVKADNAVLTIGNDQRVA
jgi:hypothetical protein